MSEDPRSLLHDLTRYLQQQQEAGTEALWLEDGTSLAELPALALSPPPPSPPPAPRPTPTPPVPAAGPSDEHLKRLAAKKAREEQFQAECDRFVQDALAQIATARAAAAAPPAPAPAAAPAQVNLFDTFGLPEPATAPADPGPAATGPVADPAAALGAIADEARACTLCALHADRTQAVPGTGNPRAKLVLIGEAPGQEEDRQGLPFVGRSGQLLTDILRAIGFEREDVFIGNILKCRPPGNRDPQREEAAACAPYLERQLAAIQPRLILCLGRIAAQRLLGTDASLGSLRRSLHFLGTTPVLATFHPAALLRNPAQKRDAWDDVRKARALYDALGDAPDDGSA